MLSVATFFCSMIDRPGSSLIVLPSQIGPFSLLRYSSSPSIPSSITTSTNRPTFSSVAPSSNSYIRKNSQPRVMTSTACLRIRRRMEASLGMFAFSLPATLPFFSYLLSSVRYCRLSQVRRMLGYVPTPSSPPFPASFPAERIALDERYMAVDLVINWAADGILLCFLHAAVDLLPQEDNDPIIRTGWSNWCGTSGFGELVESSSSSAEPKLTLVSANRLLTAS